MNRKQCLLAATILGLSFWNVAHANAAPTTTDTTPAGKGRATGTAPARRAATPKATPAAPARSHRAAPVQTEALIVTGTHAANRSARQSISPVSVVTAATLQRSGLMNIADALTRTYAEINVSAMGLDTGSLTSSIRMRGLNPNEVLVLVDGERRHTTANIYADPGPEFGSTPVDLNMLPANAIDHIEVLEDGAAAMYGSDAIAGVVNIITKHTDHGLNMSAQTGADAYAGQGWGYQVGVDGGTKILGNGYLHVSGQVYHADHFIANGTEDHRLVGYTPPGADADLYTAKAGGYQPSAGSVDKFMSTPEETRENLLINFGKPITQTIDFYGQITYAHRHSEGYEYYRTPDVAALPDGSYLYPQGFTPIETNDENDYAGELGLRGRDLFGFDWHLSTVYGADEDSIGNKNTANPTLLAAGTFYGTKAMAEQYRMAQWTNSLDFRRNFLIANTVPVVWAFGGQHRLETYNIRAGNAPSYEDGGTQGYAGLTPQDAGAWSRDVWAAWMDGDFHFTRKWEVDFAGRFEHYTDVGNTENGKVSTRYNFNKRIAIRGTISNGFRAPTLAEEHFSALNVSPNGAGGLLPTTSSAAASLGAVPLKPERSTSESGGVVLMPIDGWHVEADVYQINVRDRIVEGGTTNGAGAVDAIEKLGIVLPSNLTGADINNVDAYYMANGASTRTQGVDLKTDYLLRLHQYGNVMLTASLDLNRTRLHHNGTGANGMQFLTAQNIAALTTAYPRSKLILNALWTVGRWDVNVRQTRYGETTDLLTYEDWEPSSAQCPNGGGSKQYSNTCFYQFKNTPRWLTDIEVGYRISDAWHVAVGADDIFNVRPRRVPQYVNDLGATPYDTDSAQIPIYGGYYYGRMNATF
jgi:iron complex outermembrane recepter protein